MSFRDNLESIYRRGSLPDRAEYLNLLEETITVLEHETPEIRPTDVSGLSGGVIRLQKNIPTIVIPDLHARCDFFMKVLQAPFTKSKTVLDAIEDETVQILCLGDGFHAESRGKKRWHNAFDEYIHSFKKHTAMDEEMTESLTLMELVMQCKCEFSDYFHFLKGNHENIQNEEGNGNHRFRKFSLEGEMVQEFMIKFYGEEFLFTYSIFEKRLPLFAIGANFLASHAEPVRFFDEQELINARMNPDVILGLTWTNNDEAEQGSVQKMLSHYLETPEHGVYFGGHRPVSNKVHFRADRKFVQIHNPDKEYTVVVFPDQPFNPETDSIAPGKGGYSGRIS